MRKRRESEEKREREGKAASKKDPDRRMKIKKG